MDQINIIVTNIFIIVIKLVYLLPILIFLIIILSAINNKKLDKYIKFITKASIITFITLFMSVFVMFLVGMVTSVLSEYGLIYLIYLILLSLILKLIKFGIEKSNLYNIKRKIINAPIYIRDVPSTYTPCEVSYLINGKIELKKDVYSTILNLISKGNLSISKTSKGIVVKELNNDMLLSPDESYIRNKLVLGDTIIKEELDEIVKSSIAKEKVLNNGVFSGNLIAFALYIIMFIISFILVLIDPNKFSDILAPLLCLTFAYAFYKVIIFVLQCMGILKFDELKKYTIKGVEEVLKWEAFEKYMIDFTRLNQANVMDVILLERYLAYAAVLNVNKKYNQQIVIELKKKIDDQNGINIKDTETILDKTIGDQNS
ncbi:MAG: DUF2207 domain-containing protein [Clostridia bacterium]|nr:DUF2207 domain-containing protein [Clostridia bacterium]MDD4386482.1 DUF2207 domain-containing protein [Clostridia bacterium]